jgi:uncharacterized protein (DUF1778 family)
MCIDNVGTHPHWPVSATGFIMAHLQETEGHSPKRKPLADATITMRIPARTRDLIDTAAASLGKSRTEFVLDSARQHAVDVLLDRRVFSLDADASTAFADMLVAPVAPNEALKRLMATKAPWE